MRYTEINEFKPSLFKRLTGVTPTTFVEMVLVVSEYKLANRKHEKSGRPSLISIEDKLLMLLMYYREYRTFLHISCCYGISEMHCWRIIKDIEQILLQSETFHLPGKKALHLAENAYEVIIVDVSEHPIERPKKNSGKIIQGKRSDIH
jgi:Helix-turn-helix of DDE superfamily endonuclease